MRKALPVILFTVFLAGCHGGGSAPVTVTKTVTTSVSASPSPAMEGDESTTSEAASSAATDDGASGSEGEAGAPLAFGDTSGGFRRLIQIVFGISIAFAASSFFLSFFSFGGGALV